MRVLPFLSSLLAVVVAESAAAQCSHTGMVPIPRQLVTLGQQSCPGVTDTFFGFKVTLTPCPDWLLEIPAHDGFSRRPGFNAVMTHAIPVTGIPFTCEPRYLLFADLGTVCTRHAPVIFGAVINFANVPCVPAPPAGG